MWIVIIAVAVFCLAFNRSLFGVERLCEQKQK